MRNKKEEILCYFYSRFILVYQIDYDLFGELLIEHLYLHLFNVLDEERGKRISE